MMSGKNGIEPGSSWAEKSALERTLLSGLNGEPVTRPEERAYYLGELAERVLASLTQDEVGKPKAEQTIAKAAKDPRAVSIIAHGDLPYADTRPYRRMAEEHGLSFTERNDPAYKGEIRLIVVSDQAVIS